MQEIKAFEQIYTSETYVRRTPVPWKCWTFSKKINANNIQEWKKNENRTKILKNLWAIVNPQKILCVHSVQITRVEFWVGDFCIIETLDLTSRHNELYFQQVSPRLNVEVSILIDFSIPCRLIFRKHGNISDPAQIFKKIQAVSEKIEDIHSLWKNSQADDRSS